MDKNDKMDNMDEKDKMNRMVLSLNQMRTTRTIVELSNWGWFQAGKSSASQDGYKPSFKACNLGFCSSYWTFNIISRDSKFWAPYTFLHTAAYWFDLVIRFILFCPFQIKQRFGSISFCCGSGSWDPNFGKVDPDPRIHLSVLSGSGSEYLFLAFLTFF